MKIECTKFKSMQKGTLQGFADFFFPDLGMEINSCSLHTKNDRQWVNLPNREYKDAEGAIKYSSYVKFPDKDKYEEFQRDAKNAISEFTAKSHIQQGTQTQQKPMVIDDLPF